MKDKNLCDNDMLKELNEELKRRYGFKLKFWFYPSSPFSEKDREVIPLILNFAAKLHNVKNKIFLLSVLGVKGYDEAVPALVEEYKFILLYKYNEPFDELLLLHLCDTVAKIESKKHFNLYVDLLTLPSTTALESIIKMLEKMKILEAEEYIFNLIEKENIIPQAWIGSVNEDLKYWCSLCALKYIIKRKDLKYYHFIQKFLHPEKLEWIQFTSSRYTATHYLNCYKKYISLASKGIALLEEYN